jgi:hypothetical protein
MEQFLGIAIVFVLAGVVVIVYRRVLDRRERRERESHPVLVGTPFLPESRLEELLLKANHGPEARQAFVEELMQVSLPAMRAETELGEPMLFTWLYEPVNGPVVTWGGANVWCFTSLDRMKGLSGKPIWATVVNPARAVVLPVPEMMRYALRKDAGLWVNPMFDNGAATFSKKEVQEILACWDGRSQTQPAPSDPPPS